MQYRGRNSSQDPHERLVNKEEFARIIQLIRELRQLHERSDESKIVYLLRYHPTILDGLSPLQDANMAHSIDFISNSNDWGFLQELINPFLTKLRSMW